MVAAAAWTALVQPLRVPAADTDDGGIGVGGARIEDRHVGEGFGQRIGPEIPGGALQREEDAPRAVPVAAADHQAAAAGVAANVCEGLPLDRGVEEEKPG